MLIWGDKGLLIIVPQNKLFAGTGTIDGYVNRW